MTSGPLSPSTRSKAFDQVKCAKHSHFIKVSLADCKYYGELPYLLTAAAANVELQFFAIERENLYEPYPIGHRLLLTKLRDRMRAAIADFNLHRLLRAAQALLADYVLAVNLVQKRHMNVTATCAPCASGLI